MEHDKPQREVQKRHLLWVNMLLRRERPFLGHWTSSYRGLLRLPRRMRRLLQRRLAVTLAGAALLLLFGRVPARAATIEVVDGEVAIADNGRCSLIEAIHNANDTHNGMIYDDCAAGDANGGEIAAVTPVGSPSRSGLFVYNSTLTGNIGWSGGGLSNGGGNVEITDSTFSENTAVNGGAIFNSGEATIGGSTLLDNDATHKAGGIYNSGSLLLSNSTVSGNQAMWYGGGLYNSGTATIINSTLTGNTAEHGGGIYNGAFSASEYGIFFYGTINLARSLVSGNVATDGGTYGGEELSNGVSVNRDVYAVVNANNFNLFGYAGDPGTVRVSIGQNDLVPDESLEEILVSTLADNGGPTRTYRLVEGSPALDIAPNEVCNADPVNGMDQRGQPRNVNKVGEVSDNDCDAGAFELQIGRPVFAPVIIK